MIIEDITIDKIINQLFQRDHLQRRKDPTSNYEGRKGSIIKRGDNVDSKPSVGDKEVLLKKEVIRRPHLLLEARVKLQKPGGSSGSDVKPKSSIKTPPRNTSPPKTRVGGSGKLRREDSERPKSGICFSVFFGN